MKKDDHKPSAVWDKHSIKTEVHRRGLTLTGIARDAGLPESACRLALMGMNRKGADAIAAALGIPFDTLFPAEMVVRSRSSRQKSTAKQAAVSRQKRVTAADERRARA